MFVQHVLAWPQTAGYQQVVDDLGLRCPRGVSLADRLDSLPQQRDRLVRVGLSLLD
jgi:hypothetical protein